MPRGQADYGMYASKEVGASVSDMGEIAARLGSIVTYDKRGDVVDFDNFEGPVLRWVKTEPTNCYARLDSTSPKSGSQNVVFQAVGANGKAGIYKTVTVLASKKLGFEISFDQLPDMLDLEFYCQYLSGSAFFKAGIKIERATGKLYIRDINDDYKEIADLPVLTSPCYYTTKFVVNFETGYYMRVLFGQAEYDVSAEPCYTAASTGAALARVDIQVITSNGAAGVVYIDDYVFTQAEP